MSAHTTHTDVKTVNASRYLQQLCKHRSHKAKTEFTPQAVRVAFETWEVEMTSTNDTLSVSVTAQNLDEAPRLQQVVEEHLQRFAAQETLGFGWRA